jgi:ParB family transcriptional regulator, chromosome partitioning protein
MTDAITIPLNKLVPWDGNVRKTGATDGIDELAASIATHGLLQSLVARKAKGGKYQVIAGRRRYYALKSLADANVIAKDYPVPCTLAERSMQAAELSLVENVIRAPMHPADQFEAFRDIIEAGATACDVAARFGIHEGLVTRRLKLGRLSPVILDAYRSDEIGLDEAEAFTLTDDRNVQERVFTELPEWQRNASNIRRMLTQGEIPATDKRVRFVGLDAYEAAGGAIRRDLFDAECEGYLLDADLLDRLVAEKLAPVKAEVAGEGWAWVESAVEIDYGTLSGFSRMYPEEVFASDSDRAEHEALSAEYDALVDEDDADADRLDEIEQRIAALPTIEQWPAETLSIAGAIVALDHAGAIRIERGLVRPGDAPKRKREGAASNPSGLPASLVADLTAQKSAAMGAELIGQPDTALAAVVHALALKAMYQYADAASCLELSMQMPHLHRLMAKPEQSGSLERIEQERAALIQMLPENPSALWDWCMERTRDELLRVLAFIAASTVDAVQRKGEHADQARLTHGAKLAQALSLDMRVWFVPGAENYFGRLSRTGILAAIDEAQGGHGPSLDKLKKTELAARAEGLVANTGWLPALFRTPSAA